MIISEEMVFALKLINLDLKLIHVCIPSSLCGTKVSASCESGRNGSKNDKYRRTKANERT